MQQLLTQNDKRIPRISATTVSSTDYESETPEESTLMNFSTATAFIETVENSTALPTPFEDYIDMDQLDGQDNLMDYLRQLTNETDDPSIKTGI